jgi:endonuclease YncB( thermonuclease family)
MSSRPLRGIENELIPPVPEGKYYNLRTGNMITVKQKGYHMNERYRVAGTEEMMVRFFHVNGYNIASAPSRPVAKERSVISKLLHGAVISRSHGAITTNTEDVAKLPIDLLEDMPTFNLAGLKARARVVRVIDGDTFEFVFFVPLSFLASFDEVTGVQTRAQAAQQKRASIINYRGSHGFYTKMTARSMGVDAAEHDTVEGVWATVHYEKEFARLGHLVYLRLGGFDKYGRVLAEIFADPDYTINLTTSLVGKLCPDTRRPLCTLYNGGTKEAAMRELPRLNIDQQRELHFRLLHGL